MKKISITRMNEYEAQAYFIAHFHSLFYSGIMTFSCFAKNVNKRTLSPCNIPILEHDMKKKKKDS